MAKSSTPSNPRREPRPAGSVPRCPGPPRSVPGDDGQRLPRATAQCLLHGFSKQTVRLQFLGRSTMTRGPGATSCDGAVVWLAPATHGGSNPHDPNRRRPERQGHGVIMRSNSDGHAAVRPFNNGCSRSSPSTQLARPAGGPVTSIPSAEREARATNDWPGALRAPPLRKATVPSGCEPVGCRRSRDQCAGDQGNEEPLPKVGQRRPSVSHNPRGARGRVTAVSDGAGRPSPRIVASGPPRGNRRDIARTIARGGTCTTGFVAMGAVSYQRSAFSPGP